MKKNNKKRLQRKNYKRAYQGMRQYFYTATAIIILIFIAMIAIASYKKTNQLISPLPIHAFEGSDFGVILASHTSVETVEVQPQNTDYWVGKYVDQYFENNSQRSEMRMIMHCLLHRESGHRAIDENGPHGDGGKAGGILQYHQPTWEAYRKLMIKEGLVTEVGSRYNPEQAIETTVWAIKTGRGLAWGPILRDSKNNNYAACQTPSWY